MKKRSRETNFFEPKFKIVTRDTFAVLRSRNAISSLTSVVKTFYFSIIDFF